MALIIVLWALVLLSVLSAAVTRTQSTEVQLAKTLLEQSEARELAKAAVAYTVSMIKHANKEAAWTIDGSTRVVRLMGRDIRVAVSSESAQIDINGAPENLLRRIIEQTAVRTMPDIDVVAAMLDWADKDDLRRLNGAEQGEYRSAGYAYGSANIPFRDTAELRLVLGMSAGLYQALLPFITVDSGQSAVDLTSSKPALRAMLQGGANDTEKDGETATRRQLAASGGNAFGGGSAFRRNAPIAGMRIQVEVPVDSRRNYGAEVTVATDRNSKSGYRIIKWHDFGPVGSGNPGTRYTNG